MSVIKPRFLIPQFRGRFSTSAESTIEDAGAKDSKNIIIVDGGQVADVVDGDPNGRLQPGTDLLTSDDSTFASDTGNWDTSDTGVSITGGKLTFASVAVGDGSEITVPVGAADYDYSFTIDTISGDEVKLIVGGTAEPAETGTGTKTGTVTAGAGTTVRFEVDTGTTSCTISIATVRLADKFHLDMALTRRIDADGFIIGNHNMRDVLPANECETVDLYHDTDATFSGATKITPNSCSAREYGNKDQSSYNSDGVNDVITIADDPNLDFGTGNGTITWRGKFPDVSSDVWFYIRFEDANNEIRFFYDTSLGKLNAFIFANNAFVHNASATWSPSANTEYHLAYTFINGVSQALYVDAVSLSLTTNTITGGDTSIAADITFFERNTDFAEEDQQESLQYNRSLSAAEVLLDFNGTDIAALDQWGNQTELVTNGDFANWTGDNPDNWTVGGESAPNREVSEVGTGEGHGGVGTGYCNVFSDSTTIVSVQQVITTVIGDRYRASIDIDTVTDGGILFQDQANADFQATYTTTGLKYIEFTATSTGVTPHVRTLNTGSADVTFKPISVVKIGATGAWQPEGITAATWYDRSSNSLDGTVSGAEARNTPGNSILFAEFDSVNARYWFAEFNPDALTFTGAYKIGQWQIVKAFSPSLAPDADKVPQGIDHSGIDTIQKYGGGLDTNKRYGKRRTWNLQYSFLAQADRDSFEDLYAQTEKLVFYFQPNINSDEIIPVRWLTDENYNPPSFDTINTTINLIEEV